VSKRRLGELQEQYRGNPLSLLDMTADDARRVVDTIAHFYREQLDITGLNGYVIGLSGGLDSTLVAYLAVGAVGAERVFGVCLPTAHTTQGDIDDTLDVMKILGIEHNDYKVFQGSVESVIEIMRSLGEIVKDEKVERIKRGNIQARIRMVVLRDFARAKNYLVAGTGNLSEHMLGYSTLAGDGLGGVDNEGIGHLFKSTARKLGKFLSLPATVMGKAPSARLWTRQTDEKDLGLSYENIDQILVGHLLGISAVEIVQAVRREEVTIDKVREIIETSNRAKHKSVMSPQAVLY